MPDTLARPVVAEGHPRRWGILVSLSLATLIVQVDQTGLILALPRMQSALDASAPQLQWVLDAYSLALAATVLTAGAASDRLGRRRVFLAGVGLFALASAAGALAASPGAVIGARAVMGIGAGMFMPGTLAILTQVFAAADRARAIGIWGSITSLGVILGPLAGGGVLQAFGWPAIFVMNLVVAVAALVAAALLVPESRSCAPAPPDPAGAILGAGGVVALTWAIIAAPQEGLISRPVLTGAAAATALLAAFALHCHRRPHGMFDLTVARSGHFQAASISAAGVMFAMTGLLYLITQQLQLVLGFGTLRAGMAILPLAAAVALASSLAPGLARRASPATVLAGGLAVVGVSAAAYAGAARLGGYPPVAVTLVLLGLGTGLAMATANDLLMGSGPADRAGLISSMNDTVQELGTALGVAVTGAVLSAVYARALARPAAATARMAADLGAGGHARGAAHEAFTAGTQGAALSIAGAALALAVATAWLLRRTVPDGAQPPRPLC